MQSVRGSDNDECDIECEVKNVVKCDDSPVASGTNPAVPVLYSQLRLDRQLHLAL